MLNLKRILFLAVVATMISAVAFGQEKKWDEYPYPDASQKGYSEYVSKSKEDQQDRFLDKKYTHPAKPKNKMEVGIYAGPMWINGDVNVRSLKMGGPGFGIGGHIRKSLGYIMSVRAGLSSGLAYGQDWQPTSGHLIEDTRNRAVTGGTYYDDFNAGAGTTPDYSNSVIFLNHKTRINELYVSGVINLNNIKFHQRRNLVSFYGYGGPGGVLYNTKMDLINGSGGQYDFPALVEANNAGNSTDPSLIRDGRERSINNLDGLLDGDYESQAERHRDDIFSGTGVLGEASEGFNYQFTVHAGLGAAVKLTRMINLGLDTKITITRDDLLDGQRWTEWGALTRDFDTYQFTSLQLNFNLGGNNSVEPLWWMSPLDYAYNELRAEPDITLPDPYELRDDDKDGVPNEFDIEPNTPAGCAVSTRGKRLDSDGDGLADCEDRQPHTPFDLTKKIDKYGVAKRPKINIPDPKCDCPVQVKEVITQVQAAPAVASCGDWFLPMIHYDLNKDDIKTEFYPHLHHIATAMQACPGMSVAVVGHTDTRADDTYNNDLSCRRAEAAINYLVTNYGIDRYRFTKSYSGETSNLIKGANKEAEHYLNRRVEFLTGSASGMYNDLGGCPGTEVNTTGTIDYSTGSTYNTGTYTEPINSNSYYGTDNSSIFIDK